MHTAPLVLTRDLTPAGVTTVAEGIARNESSRIRKSAEFIARATLVVGTAGIAIPVAPARDESLRFLAANETGWCGLRIRGG